MADTLIAKTSAGVEPLWGLRDVTKPPQEALRGHLPVQPWKHTWIPSSVELEKAPITPFQRPSSPYSSITEEITTVLRRLEELKVRTPALDDVWQYFEKHPRFIEMTRVLSELASERLRDAVLSLEISRDPEEDEEYVVLYARFHNYDENTIKIIRSVREEFLSSLGEEEEWPLLTTDFRNP